MGKIDDIQITTMAMAANRYDLIESIFKCDDPNKIDRVMGLYHPDSALDGWGAESSLQGAQYNH